MPMPEMTQDEQKAYDEALKRIEACLQLGKRGTRLVLGGLRLTALPPEIGQLTALTTLNLYSNRLRTLPPEIGQLTGLTELHLSHNQLSELPPEICQLTALIRLDLSYTKIRALPSGIGQLTALTALFLRSNQLSELPPEIGQLIALTELHLQNNQLSSLPPEIGRLTALTELYLYNNHLSALPSEIGQLSALKALFLHGNPGLGFPAEVLGPERDQTGKRAKPAEILAYYFAQKGGATRPLNEVKVLVVGESEVGKTSLIRQLRGQSHNPQEDKTHGIERHRVMLPCGRLGQVRLNVWDFGGQDIMHATHQFFLTHRSVYLLVLDSRQNEPQSRIDYWLRLIASYGGGSPVIVVCNKADQQVMQLNWTALQRDYPQIIAFAREVCCYHHAGVDRRCGLDGLRQLIAQAVEQHVAQVDQPMLTRWLDLKDELEKAGAEGQPYLTLEEYHTLAEKRGISKPQDREILLSLMHQLGSVLHFSEHAIFEQERARQAAPAHVEELNVLDPGWVTAAIYRLLNDPALIRAGGLMDRGSMRASLAALPGNRYPGHKEDFIIAMMRRFEICFAFDGESDRWFLPDLLHKDEVHTGDWAGAVSFRYQYRVLPTSIIGRLMVRLHSYIARHCLWRTGAKFIHDSCEALVRSDPENERIDIYVRGGTKAARLRFLSLIRGTLRDIHQSFSRNLGIEEWVPVPRHPEVYIEYEKLLLLEARGTPKDTVKVHGRIEDIEVTSVLDHVTEPAQRKIERKALAAREQGRAPAATTTIHMHFDGDYIQGEKNMSSDFNLTNHGSISNAQFGQTLTNCTQMIQQQTEGQIKTLLEDLEKDVQSLLARLPEQQKQETAENLELLVKTATSEKPNRKWYSVSSEGLLEATKYVKDFTGNIAGTLANLGRLLWPAS